MVIERVGILPMIITVWGKGKSLNFSKLKASLDIQNTALKGLVFSLNYVYDK